MVLKHGFSPYIFDLKYSQYGKFFFHVAKRFVYSINNKVNFTSFYAKRWTEGNPLVGGK